MKRGTTMELISIYEKYTDLNEGYVALLERLVDTDFAGDQAAIKQQLIKTKEQFEVMMEQTAALEVEQDQEQNLQDLKYLLTDSLFLSIDIVSFFEYEAYGRFKMRVLNYVNKKRRSEFN